VGHEDLGVEQRHVGLDVLHLPEGHRARPGQLLAQPLGYPAAPEPVVADVQVEDAAGATALVERVVVQGGPGRIVVGVDEEPGRRVEHLRHLPSRQDLERHRLAPLGVAHRQPLVAARAVAEQPRRVALDPAGLEVLADRGLGAGEVAQVALHVGVGPVLRADVEEVEAAPEVVEVPGAVPA
jgi:hypothetical protein